MSGYKVTQRAATIICPVEYPKPVGPTVHLGGGSFWNGPTPDNAYHVETTKREDLTHRHWQEYVEWFFDDLEDAVLFKLTHGGEITHR